MFLVVLTVRFGHLAKIFARWSALGQRGFPYRVRADRAFQHVAQSGSARKIRVLPRWPSEKYTGGHFQRGCFRNSRAGAEKYDFLKFK